MPLSNNLILTILVAGIGTGFQHGYNTAVTNSVQTFNEALIRQRVPDENLIKTIFSMIVSIMTIGGLIGGLSTKFIAEKFGRKQGLFWNNVLAIIAGVLMWLGSMYGNLYELILAGRFIIGLNAGLNAGLGPMYLTEISPVDFRGAIGTVYQLIITISIFLSAVLGLRFILGTAESWPWLYGITAIPAVLMMIFFYFCPESPKYLLATSDDEEKAKKTLQWLRGKEDVQTEMDEMKAENESQKKLEKPGIKDFFSNPALRAPLIISVVIMLGQQLSGINAVIYYSNSIFREQVKLEDLSAQYATLGLFFVNILMTVVSLVLIDRMGRKTLLLLGFGGMFIMTIILTVSLSLTAQMPWLAVVSIIGVYGFVIMFATGPGSIPWFLVSELFSVGARPLASSIAVAVNWLANFCVAFSFELLNKFLQSYVFLVFAVLLALFFIYTWKNVPETKGKQIEEITAQFEKNQ